MAADFCTVCGILKCNPSPDKEMFRKAVLLWMCNQELLTSPSEDSAVVSNVASSATSVQLVAANADRKGLTIFNDSTQILKIKFGVTASATDFTVEIAAGGVYNMSSPIYGGRIDGIWAAANGFARITEW